MRMLSSNEVRLWNREGWRAVCAETCQHGSGRGTRHTRKGQRSLLYHWCPRSSARIEQRPPEPCVGRSNRLGGTSSQSLNHSCRPSTVLCYLVSALAKCPFHTYTASTYILASFPRKRESRRRRAGGLDARLRGHDVLLVPDLRNGHLVPLPPAAFLLLLTCKILSTACMTCNMVVIHTRWLGSGCRHPRV